MIFKWKLILLRKFFLSKFKSKGFLPVFSLGIVFLILFVSTPGLCQEAEPLVEVIKLDSTIVIDLRYATTNNFTGIQLYSVAKCYLRKSVAERLVRVHKLLQKVGYGIKIWDGYRPLSVQKRMWEIVPNPRYVAPPSKGSRHNRGAAVDVTLVDSLGNDVEMPTDFDDFTRRAAPDFPDVPPKVKENRKLLREAMLLEGFRGISSEWWHYDAPGYRKFAILDIPIEEIENQKNLYVK